MVDVLYLHSLTLEEILCGGEGGDEGAFQIHIHWCALEVHIKKLLLHKDSGEE